MKVEIPALVHLLQSPDQARQRGHITLVVMFGHHMKRSMDQPGKVANPARAQLNMEK